MDALLSDIHLPNIQNNLKVQFRELSRNFAVTYRVYLKLLSSQHNLNYILEPSLDETMVLKVESDNVTSFFGKLLKRNEFTIPEEFIIQNTRSPRNIAQKSVQRIIEDPHGRVLTRFNSCRKKGSSPKFSENVKLPRSSYSMPSKSSNYDYLKGNKVEDSQKIYYKAKITKLDR